MKKSLNLDIFIFTICIVLFILSISLTILHIYKDNIIRQNWEKSNIYLNTYTTNIDKNGNTTYICNYDKSINIIKYDKNTINLTEIAYINPINTSEFILSNDLLTISDVIFMIIYTFMFYTSIYILYINKFY